MAVYHLAHLFDLGRFTSSIAPYLRDRGRDAAAYGRLRADGLSAYERNPEVRRLASEYGGWDLDAITTEIPAEGPEDLEDEVFWIGLLLYDSFRPTKSPLGLGERWRLPGDAVPQGLDESDWRLLVRGRNFAELPVGTAAHLDLLGAIRPGSTASHAGWLGVSDIGPLVDRVDRAIGRLPRLRGTEQEGPVLSSAAAMLAAAQKAESALCLVASG